MSYLLDANVFIQAKNLHYSFDFCPAFWDWLDVTNGRRCVFSIAHVREELLAGDDELSQWTRQRDGGFFLAPDEAIVPSLGTVSGWALHGRYEPAAVSAFLQDTDYYLIAHAHAHGHTVVTHEVPSASTKKVKIPNACIGVDVRCMSPYEMLRVERARFVLGTGTGPDSAIEA